jgi:hypothetical protein
VKKIQLAAVFRLWIIPHPENSTHIFHKIVLTLQ